MKGIFRDSKAFADDFGVVSLGMSRLGGTSLMSKISGHSASGRQKRFPFDTTNDGYPEKSLIKWTLVTAAKYVGIGVATYAAECPCWGLSSVKSQDRYYWIAGQGA